MLSIPLNNETINTSLNPAKLFLILQHLLQIRFILAQKHNGKLKNKHLSFLFKTKKDKLVYEQMFASDQLEMFHKILFFRLI